MNLQNMRNCFLFCAVLSNSLLLHPASAADGSVEGYVKNTDGNPVTGLYVDACVAPCTSWIAGPKTDANGYYKITLPAGTYKIRYYTFGDHAQYAANWYHNQPDYAHADDVQVQAGLTNALNETTLTSGGSISGTVTNGSAGIAGVTAYIYSNKVWTGRSATTNELGGYKVSGLATGDYTVKFSGVAAGLITEWYDNQESQDAATPVSVTSPSETPNINAVLASGGTISGKVTISETGAPLAGAWVAVCDSTTATTCNSSNPARKGYVQTGADGSYTVGGLSSSGSYKVQFFERMVNNAGSGVNKWYAGTSDVSNAQVVSLSAGNLNNVDMAFNGARISGTVTKAGGGGIEGVTVEAYDSSGKKVVSSNQTGADGVYNIAGLLRGSCKLYFKAIGTDYVSEWYNDAVMPNTANSIAIASLADALTINAELAAGSSISGKVEIQRNPDSSSVPVDGGLVQVYDSANSSILKGASTTRSDGTYDVTGLPTTGSFKVRFFSSAAADGSAGYGISEWYDDQHSFDQATEVSSGATDINAVLEPSNLIPAYKLLLLKKRY